MISDDYIMGFVEGEGCFSVAIQKEIDRRPRKTKIRAKWKKPSLGFKVTPNFRVTAVSEENAVLYELKERFGAGEVYSKKRITGGTPNTKPASDYCVQSVSDCAKIVEFFKDKYFHTSKGKSFQLWVKCLEIIKSKKHLTKEGLLEICKLRDKMNPKLGGKHSRVAAEVQMILDAAPGHIEAHSTQSLIHNPSESTLKYWYQKRQGNFKPTELLVVSGNKGRKTQ